MPLMGKGIAINQNVTHDIQPRRRSWQARRSMNPIQMMLTYPGFTTTVPQETIQVSNYGNITVTP